MAENAYWTETRKRFRADLDNQDINHFKVWPNSVLYVPIYNFSQFEQQYGYQVFQMIDTLPEDQKVLWENAIKEPFLGHTEESYKVAEKNFVLENGKEYKATPWTLKSAHHILTYLTKTGRSLDAFDTIVEFGPGIGETCRMICDLGFKGDYYLVDLPEVVEISKFYNKDYPNVKAVSDYKEVPNTGNVLFIGTWSISECPLSFRNEVFTHFKDADYLIIFQHRAFEYDNFGYFMIQFPQIINKNVKLVDIQFLDHIAGGNKYLLIE